MFGGVCACAVRMCVLGGGGCCGVSSGMCTCVVCMCVCRGHRFPAPSWKDVVNQCLEFV